MTISDLGSIGEFVSSIAVVFSLVYVAIQVRQNSRETRMASRQRVIEASRDMITQMATREISELNMKAEKKGRDTLSEAEDYQYRLVRMAQLRNIENAYLMLQDGVIDDDVFEFFAGRAEHINRVDPDIAAAARHTKAFKAWLDQLGPGT